MSTKTISGVLVPFAETGTEGYIWSVGEDGKKGGEALHNLQNGDSLVVFKDASREAVLWQGTVALEFERDRRPRWPGASHSQQFFAPDPADNEKGYWVHGFQKDLPPGQWAEMFFAEHPASLTFAAKSQLRL